MFWIAVGENNRVVGCVGYEIIKPLEARLHRLYVKPELKRQRIGTVLLNVLTKYIKEKGYNKLSIHAGDEKYWESKFFYKSQGFVEVDYRILEKDI